MRTTISIDENLLREAKIIAAASDKTLSDVVSDALRESILRRRATPKKRIKLITSGGQGLQPGVDASSNAALLDAVDEYDAFPGR
jgi:hypothetical protein